MPTDLLQTVFVVVIFGLPAIGVFLLIIKWIQNQINKRAHIKQTDVCPNCRGKRYVDSRIFPPHINCGQCKGTGRVPKAQANTSSPE